MFGGWWVFECSVRDGVHSLAKTWRAPETLSVPILMRASRCNYLIAYTIERCERASARAPARQTSSMQTGSQNAEEIIYEFILSGCGERGRCDTHTHGPPQLQSSTHFVRRSLFTSLFFFPFFFRFVRQRYIIVFGIRNLITQPKFIFGRFFFFSVVARCCRWLGRGLSSRNNVVICGSMALHWFPNGLPTPVPPLRPLLPCRQMYGLLFGATIRYDALHDYVLHTHTPNRRRRSQKDGKKWKRLQ